MKTITVTKDHILLIRNLYIDWDDNCEYGAISSDCKRPFGNSSVEEDVREILEYNDNELDSKDVKRLVVECTAVVSALLKNANSDLIGQEIQLPWRAERELK